MKKLMIIMMTCLMLFGCAAETDLYTTFHEALNDAASLPGVNPTHSKGFYRYYVPRDVGVLTTTPTGTIFVYDSARYVMNLNTANIVSQLDIDSEDFIQNLFSEDYLEAERKDIFVDYEGKEVPYICRVYSYEGNYYVSFATREVSFYGVGSYVQAIGMLEHMMTTARSVSINEDEILSAYGSKELIVTEKEDLGLFEMYVPAEGRVDALLSSGETQTGEVVEPTGDNYGEDQEYTGDSFGDAFGDNIDQNLDEGAGDSFGEEVQTEVVE